MCIYSCIIFPVESIIYPEEKMKKADRKTAAAAAISRNGGIASYAALIAEGLSKADIHRLCQSGEIKSIRRGYYSSENADASEEECIAGMLPDSIVCGGSALHRYGYSDYTPRKWMLAVPRNISRSRLVGTGIPMKIHYDSYYGLGKTEEDFNGIRLPVYDRERIICDCIRNRDTMDKEMFIKALRSYAADSAKDLGRLSDYAERLRISEKVRNIMEIVLNA